MPERNTLCGLVSIKLAVIYTREKHVLTGIYSVVLCAGESEADRIALAMILRMVENSRNRWGGTVRRSCSIHSKTMHSGSSVDGDTTLPTNHTSLA